MPAGYSLKREVKIINAIYARHKGTVFSLQTTLSEMVNYIKKNKLQQITTFYNVQINEPKSEEAINEIIVDSYIGINPNIL